VSLTAKLLTVTYTEALLVDRAVLMRFEYGGGSAAAMYMTASAWNGSRQRGHRRSCGSRPIAHQIIDFAVAPGFDLGSDRRRSTP
jgi:hypothetical protein